MASRDAAHLVDLGDATPLSPAYIEAFFRPFVRGGGARALVSAILADDDRVAWCAARGYRHHNDISKIVLAASATGRKLVWHDWHQHAPWADGDRHNHRWDFVSYVVTGELELTDFEEDPAGPVTATRYAYESPDGRAEYALRRTGPAHLRETRRFKAAAGDFYHQPHRTVHTAASRSRDTGTLIVQGEVAMPDTDVYVTGAAGRHLRRTAPRYSPAELRPLLTRLRDAL
jgi:hypothetical protein